MANLPDWLSTAFAIPLFGADHRQMTTDFTRRQSCGALPLFIWKELAAHCDFHPVAIWVIHFLSISIVKSIALMMPSPNCSLISSLIVWP